MMDHVSLKRRRRVIWLYDRDGYPVRCRWRALQCHYCKIVMSPDHPERRPTWDHKIPKSRGGTNKQANLVRACNRCNQLKGAMTAEEFVAFLRQTGTMQHVLASRLSSGSG